MINEIEYNLVKFYSAVGATEGCFLSHEKSFSVISGPGNSWPQLIFNLDYSYSPDQLVPEISERITRHGQPLYFISNAYLQNKHLTLLRENGFFPVDYWIMMDLDLAESNLVTLENPESQIKRLTTNDELVLYCEMLNQELLKNSTINVSVLQSLSKQQNISLWGLFTDEKLQSGMVVFTEGSVAGLYLVGTSKTCQRKGLASMLLNAVLGGLKENGITKVILHSSRKGFSLYQNAGFESRGYLYIYLKVAQDATE